MGTLYQSLPQIVALLTAAVIFMKVDKIRNFHKYMAYSLIFDGLFQLLDGVLFSRSYVFSPFLYILFVFLMLAGPVMYFFASVSFLKKEGLAAGQLWMSVIPAVFVIAVTAAICGASQDALNGFHSILNGTAGAATLDGAYILAALDSAAFLLFLAEQLFVIVYCLVNLKRYVGLLETYYSDLGGKSWDKFAIILILVALRYVLYVSDCFFPVRERPEWLELSMEAVSCLFYVAIALSVCTIRFTASELSDLIGREIQAGNQAVKPSGHSQTNEIIAQRLEKLVETKFFLERDTDLIWLSSKLQVNSKYVAEYLKQTYGETFMNYVNRLRIEYSVCLMNESGLSLTDIAWQSGYSTASTYYRNFQKVKGVSPSDFRKSINV